MLTTLIAISFIIYMTSKSKSTQRIIRMIQSVKVESREDSVSKVEDSVQIRHTVANSIQYGSELLKTLFCNESPN